MIRRFMRRMARKAIAAAVALSAISSCTGQEAVTLQDAANAASGSISAVAAQAGKAAEGAWAGWQGAAGSATQEAAIADAAGREGTGAGGAGAEIGVTFIDVGQGDSILIQDGGSNMLIDTGYYKEKDALYQALSERGVEDIDVLVLTHPDADHIGSAAAAIKDYGADAVYMADKESDSGSYARLVEALEEKGIEARHPVAGDRIPFGTASYEVVGPVAYGYDDPNSCSIIIRMVNGEDSFLFTGDATGEETDDILDAGVDVRAGVYKAAHHGSANEGCNSERFMDAAGPGAIVISCGYGNSYGHPHAEVMAMAEWYGMDLYRTDLQGTISCTSTGKGVIWHTAPSEDYRNGNMMD